MIWLLSDPHGEADFPGLHDYLSRAGDDDWLLLLGDVCLSFERTEENRAFTEWFLSLEKNIAFLDGNHENFAYLASFPEEDWHGGRVHRLNPHIVHMERGYVYTLGGRSFFACGGCRSSAKWAEMGLYYEGEEPTEEECARGRDSLAAHGCRVDYVLTHKYETEGPKAAAPLLALTQYIEENVTYSRWYFGHNHRPRTVDEKHVCVYDILVPLT